MAPKKRRGRRAARSKGSQTAARHGSCSGDGGSDDFPADMAKPEAAGQETEEICDDNGAERIDDEDDYEIASLYPASQLAGGARSTYRSGGGHFVTGDPRAMASDLASTRSLWTMDLDYRELHGRRYCRDYYMPNDELEQLRVTLLHQVFVHILDGELTLAPLEEPPSRVLDVGTGTGEWAIRMAEMFPECEVVGTDISAIAETESVPVNVFFEIEDAEDWDRPPDHYDMIHMRWLAGSFRDWRFVYDCAYYSLKPGGWIEVLDFDGFDGMVCIDHFPPESPIHRLFKDIHKAAELSGRKLSMDHLNGPDFMDAGFVDIRVMEYSLPLVFGEPSIDKLWLMALIDGIESSALRLLTEHMGWDPDECKAVCEQVARDMANLTKHPTSAKDLVIKLRLVVARKPLEAPTSKDSWPAEEPLHMRARREGRSPKPEAASLEVHIAHTDEVEPHATGEIIPNGPLYVSQKVGGEEV
ncbi:Secondary metabolism regulator LAE1 [Trichoderma ghanense]|uniref:Secondary metabolism regulator LAE1 n=1 Tax=Trichoderma ghanense TaxID=65468 RepID=A0ABY2GZV5_9HYPO